MGPRFPFQVYAVCLLGLSCLAGVVLALQTGYALSAFSAEGRIAGIVAIAMIRSVAPRIAALSACIALVTQMHRSHPEETPGIRRMWLMFSTLPLGAIVSGAAGTSMGVLIALGIYRLTLSTCWKAMRDFVIVADFGYGVAHACGYAVALGLAGNAALSYLARKAHWRVRAKLAFIWVVAGVSCAAVDVAWRLVSPAETDPEPEHGEQVENSGPRGLVLLSVLQARLPRGAGASHVGDAVVGACVGPEKGGSQEIPIGAAA